MKKTRLIEMDVAKGFAIFLVVLGHVVARQPPLGNSWYVAMKDSIYFFHMPFFMFLSGFILAFTYPPISNFGEYRRYIKGKFKRIIPPFLVVGILILIGKVISANFVHIDNKPDGFFEGIFSLLFDPSNSAASSLWYIYTLFLFYLAAPLIFSTKDRLLVWILIGLMMNLTHNHLTSYFLIDHFFEYFLFVIIGVAVCNKYESFTYSINKYGIYFLSVFIILILGFSSYLVVPKLLLGLLSIPALMYLIKKHLHNNNIFAWLGKYVFIIYLLNTIFIGVVKAVGLKFLSWDYYNFLIYFPVLSLAGLLLPIAVKKFILSKNTILNEYTN